MNTTDLIEALRSDIKEGLRKEILAELQPVIQRQLHANIFPVDDAAKYLKVGETTLRRMVKENEVPYFKQRGNYYFRQIDLDKHIASIVKQPKRKARDTG